MSVETAVEGAGQIVSAIRLGQANTRSELAAITGQARGTVARRLELLLATGILVPGQAAKSTGGRPSETFRLNPDVGVLLVADVGATRTRVAVCDYLGGILAEHEEQLDVATGPNDVLEAVTGWWGDLVQQLRDTPRPVRGVSMSVPGPVNQELGATVSPPIMTGWDRFPIRDTLAQRYDCLAVVDNDVNAMVLGEHRDARSDQRDLLMLKIGTGVGAGLIVDGEVFRGSIGAAGDIGHIQMEGVEQRRCRCGNVGCVEAVAGGWALRQQLAEHGFEADSSDAVVELVRRGEPVAVELVRTAGEVLGGAISHAVNLLNPAVVVLGGDLVHAREHLLAGIRQVVYERSLPLATADLRFEMSVLDRRAGVVGNAHMVADLLLDPGEIERQLADSGTWPATS